MNKDSRPVELHPQRAALPDGTTLRVTGRPIRSRWSDKTYNVLAETPSADGRSVSMWMVGYVHRADERLAGPWIVRALDGTVIVSPASIVNDSRASALWLGEKAEWPSAEVSR